MEPGQVPVPTGNGGPAGEWRGSHLSSDVLFPESVGEVQELVRRAIRNRSKLMPAGAGSWLEAGGWGGEADTVVSLSRFGGITHYEPADLTLTAGAGLPWSELEDAVRANGQWLPVDPPGVRSGTVGGLVATGGAGSLRGLYGATRDVVLGVEAVTGEGRLLELGARVVKNVAGYDLVRLLTGSRGSLALITAVSVRLFPEPQSDGTLVYQGSDDEMVALARHAAELPLLLAGLELDLDGGGTLLVRVLGGGEEVAAGMGLVEDRLGTPEKRVEGEASAQLHRERSKWEGEGRLVVRISALPALLERTAGTATMLARELGGAVSCHVSQGVARVGAELPPDDLTDDVVDLIQETRRDIGALGGSLLVSSSPPGGDAPVPWTGGPGSEEELAERIKGLFDPHGVLAPRIPAT